MELTNEIRERIKLVVDKAGLSQKRFSEKINYSSNKIAEILNGNNKTLSNQFVQLLESHFGVNPKWLETGIGSPCILSVQANDLEEQLLLKTFRLLGRSSKNILNGTCTVLYEEEQKKKQAESLPEKQSSGPAPAFQREIESPWKVAEKRSPYGKTSS